MPPANRAQGVLRANFIHRGGRTQVDRVHEAGGLRLRFPNVLPGHHPSCEAVCINTGGGMVGGDSAALDFTCAAGAGVTVTTQSAEKIYRSEGAGTTVAATLTLEPGATLEWLPQESILFDRIHLARSIAVDMAADARLLMIESLVFGRLAMGEQVRTGHVQDRWRIRRAGRLVFAEDFRVSGDVAAQLDRPALGGGARAVSTLLLVAPDAEQQLEPVRAALGGMGATSGASAWNGMLAVRALSPSPDGLRATMLAVLQILRGRTAPRVWQ